MTISGASAQKGVNYPVWTDSERFRPLRSPFVSAPNRHRTSPHARSDADLRPQENTCPHLAVPLLAAILVRTSKGRTSLRLDTRAPPLVPSNSDQAATPHTSNSRREGVKQL